MRKKGRKERDSRRQKSKVKDEEEKNNIRNVKDFEREEKKECE